MERPARFHHGRVERLTVEGQECRGTPHNLRRGLQHPPLGGQLAQHELVGAKGALLEPSEPHYKRERPGSAPQTGRFEVQTHDKIRLGHRRRTAGLPPPARRAARDSAPDIPDRSTPVSAVFSVGPAHDDIGAFGGWFERSTKCLGHLLGARLDSVPAGGHGPTGGGALRSGPPHELAQSIKTGHESLRSFSRISNVTAFT